MVCKLYLKEEGGGRGEEKEKEGLTQAVGTRGPLESWQCSAVGSGAGYQGVFCLRKFLQLFVYASCTILYEHYMPVTKFTERKHSQWVYHFFPCNNNL